MCAVGKAVKKHGPLGFAAAKKVKDDLPATKALGLASKKKDKKPAVGATQQVNTNKSGLQISSKRY